MTPEPLLEWTMLGADPQPRGNRDPDRAPQGVYPSAGEDRWVAISVEDDAAWAALRSALGDPAWAQDPALATLDGRLARHDDIDRELSAWTSARTSHEAMHVLQAERIAAVAVLDGPELVEDPQLRHRGFLVDIDHPEVGVTASAGIPLHSARRGSTTEIRAAARPAQPRGVHGTGRHRAGGVRATRAGLGYRLTGPPHGGRTRFGRGSPRGCCACMCARQPKLPQGGPGTVWSTTTSSSTGKTAS